MASLCSILQIYNDSLIYKCDKWTFTACKTVLTMYIVKTKRVQLNIQLKLKHEQNMYKNGSVQSQTYSLSAETNESKYSIRLYSTNNVKQINDYNNGANFSEIISAQFCIFILCTSCCPRKTRLIVCTTVQPGTEDTCVVRARFRWLKQLCNFDQNQVIGSTFFPLEYIRDFNVWLISKFIKAVV